MTIAHSTLGDNPCIAGDDAMLFLRSVHRKFIKKQLIQNLTSDGVDTLNEWLSLYNVKKPNDDMRNPESAWSFFCKQDQDEIIRFGKWCSKFKWYWVLMPLGKVTKERKK